MSWVVSPLLSGAVSALIYVPFRKFVLSKVSEYKSETNLVTTIIQLGSENRKHMRKETKHHDKRKKNKLFVALI